MDGVIVLVLVFSTGAIIALGVTFLQLRAKLKAIEVLKIYAQMGEEPPRGVVEAINQVGRPPPLPPRRPRTRGQELTHFTGSLGLAIGIGAVALWRTSQPGGNLDALAFAFVIVVFFAANAAARLVAAAHATDDGRR